MWKQNDSCIHWVVELKLPRWIGCSIDQVMVDSLTLRPAGGGGGWRWWMLGPRGRTVRGGMGEVGGEYTSQYCSVSEGSSVVVVISMLSNVATATASKISSMILFVPYMCMHTRCLVQLLYSFYGHCLYYLTGPVSLGTGSNSSQASQAMSGGGRRKGVLSLLLSLGCIDWETSFDSSNGGVVGGK